MAYGGSDKNGDFGKLSDFKHYFLAGELYISDNFLKIVFYRKIFCFGLQIWQKKGLNDINSSNKNGDVCIFIGTFVIYGVLKRDFVR